MPKDGDIGLLKIHVLGIRLPEGPTCKDGGTDDDDVEEEWVAKAINGKGQVEWYKHSRFQSSLQLLDPIKQGAIWKDTTGSVAVFYTTRPGIASVCNVS